MEPEDGQYSRAKGKRPRENDEEGHWSNNLSRPTTAPANLYNYENRFSRVQSSQGSESSSESSYSTNSDTDSDDQHKMETRAELSLGADNPSFRKGFNQQLNLNPSEYSTRPPKPDRSRRSRLSFDGVYRGRGRSHDREGSPSDETTSRMGSRRPDGKRRKGWGMPSDRWVVHPYPHDPDSTMRLYTTRRPSFAEDIDFPAPDHRRLVHHSFASGYGSFSPTARSTDPSLTFALQSGGHLPNYSPKRSRSPSNIPGRHTETVMSDGDPFFRPSRGDVIIVMPEQRGRMPDQHGTLQNFGCVRSVTGTDADLVFRDGDLVVRIGTYAPPSYRAAVSYIPYRILQLYGRHEGVWKFLGDAQTEEDLGEKRRNESYLETHPFVGRVGEQCNIEPNYGDIIIRPDKIRCGDQHDVESSSVIQWWTPDLREEVNRIYPHDTILLRPYVRNLRMFRDRESWLGKWVTRHARGRKVEQGTISKVWPESIVRDGPPSNLRDLEALEVLGPDRVGVRVLIPNPTGDGMEFKETVAWSLSSTVFDGASRPILASQSVEEWISYKNDPWGSIEIYIYSAGGQPSVGWVYWGRSKQICDTPYPSRPPE